MQNNGFGSGARKNSGARRRSSEAGSFGRRSADTGPPKPGTPAQAKDACLRLLTDRARSRSELFDKLMTKGFTPDVIDPVLDRLTELKLIDDVDFAHQWVTSRHLHSGKGKRAIGMELRTKGIDPGIAAEALDTIDADDERDRARELVVKKLRTLARSEHALDTDRAQRDKTVRKLVAMLARKGFASGMAFAVVKEELEALGSDTDGLEVD